MLKRIDKLIGFVRVINCSFMHIVLAEVEPDPELAFNPLIRILKLM